MRTPSDSPVFARGLDLHPRIRRAASPWVLPVAFVGACGVGAAVFLALQPGRIAKAQPSEPPHKLLAATAIIHPQEPAPPAAAPAFVPRVLPPPAVSLADPSARRRAPAMVIDLSAPETRPAAASTVAAPVASVSTSTAARSADEKLFDWLSPGQPQAARAAPIANPGRTIVQGTVVPAVLETAIDSNLPGFARAVVSRDVRAMDGGAVLIPRGSKLIGQYHSGVADGQSRAFVVWSRLVTPQGVSVELESPAADPQGRAGLAGDTDTHFLRRFGASILLSVLGGVIDAAVAEQGGGRGPSAVVIGSPAQASRLAELALQSGLAVKPTVRIPQGEPIRVFVARDLDFFGAR